jgi:hypothetical protein
MKQIKKEAKKLLHVAVGREEGKKIGLIRDVEFVRPIYSMIYPFQLFGAFLLVR